MQELFHIGSLSCRDTQPIAVCQWVLQNVRRKPFFGGSGSAVAYPARVWYDNTADWKDVLRSVEVNGITYNISYDGSGNPIRYNNGSAELDMSWTNGRQLSYVGCYDEQWQVAYYYDANGIRASKYDDGIWHTYITQNGKVVRETIGSGNTAKNAGLHL